MASSRSFRTRANNSYHFRADRDKHIILRGSRCASEGGVHARPEQIRAWGDANGRIPLANSADESDVMCPLTHGRCARMIVDQFAQGAIK